MGNRKPQKSNKVHYGLSENVNWRFCCRRISLGISQENLIKIKAVFSGDRFVFSHNFSLDKVLI